MFQSVIKKILKKPSVAPLKTMSDIERIADLCLNYKSPKMQFDELADKIRVLQLEVQILCQRLESAEQQNQQYKKAIESL